MTVTLTPGWIGRHTPANAEAGGRDAAIIDIAQDLLLRELDRRGALGAVAFKGGTALRKLYAGNQGRFSTDLDFSLAVITDDPDDVVLELIAAIDGTTVGPFAYGVRERRGKWSLIIESPFNEDESDLSSKLDVSPAVWMTPVRRGWVPMSVHATYGEPPLPELQAIRMEENLAEKISRLNRTTTARDMYDLAWIAAHHHEIGGVDRDLVRRLTVLKIWVDANGVSAGRAVWKPSHEPAPFEPDYWLRPRDSKEFDLGDIGALAVPTPSAVELSEVVRTNYGFLSDLDTDERRLAAARGQDRPLALKLLAALPGGHLNEQGLY
jgi:predicted nucleotidyltransferase component of viral defense system